MSNRNTIELDAKANGLIELALPPVIGCMAVGVGASYLAEGARLIWPAIDTGEWAYEGAMMAGRVLLAVAAYLVLHHKN